MVCLFDSSGGAHHVDMLYLLYDRHVVGGAACNVTAADRTVEAKPDKAQPSSELSHSKSLKSFYEFVMHFQKFIIKLGISAFRH